jgi:hypothetical protein
MRHQISRESILDPEEVKSMLGSNEYLGEASSEDSIAIGSVLIFSAFVGEDPEQLAIASGLTLGMVRGVADRLRVSGVFGIGEDHFCSYFENENSGIQIICDVQCGEGILRRGEPSNGSPTFVMTPKGIEYVEKTLIPRIKNNEPLDGI